MCIYIYNYVLINLKFWLLHAGEAKVGNIYKDDLAERTLKTGDIYRISAGSAFYIVNTGEGQRLHIICSIDPAESLGLREFQVCVCVSYLIR